jgi:hypothetical protein
MSSTGLRGIAWVACAAGLGLLPCVAGADEPLPLEKFTERLSKDVPVSGRLLVGAVVVDAARAPALAPRLLWRGAAAESAGEAKVTHIASRDGLYYGEGEIFKDKLAALAGPQRVQGGHSSEAVGHLRGLAADDLAMLATRGDCRVGAGEARLNAVHLLDRRDPAAAGPFKLRLMLNSLGYTLALEAAVAGGARQPLACSTLEGAQRNKAFNTQCELGLPGKAGEADLFIQRRRFERGFPELLVHLSWAAP